jgi:hypothetical protein
MRLRSLIYFFLIWFGLLQCISPFVHLHLGNDSQHFASGLHIHALKIAPAQFQTVDVSDSIFSVQQDVGDEHVLTLDIAVKNKNKLIDIVDIPFIILPILLAWLVHVQVRSIRPFEFLQWSNSITLFPSPRAPPAH